MDTTSDSFCDSNEFFETAFEEYFPEVRSEEPDKCRELSRLTNKVLTPGAIATDPCENDDVYFAFPQEYAKEYLQSSTPKRLIEFSRTRVQSKLITRLNDVHNKTGEDDDADDVQNSSGQPELPSRSMIIQEHRRHRILSPFSQNLKGVILRKESARKRKQRIEMSKKAQRASLRV